MSKSILVVAAHADDEVLGCGGTIRKHVLRGDSVSVLFMTDGVGSRSVNKTEVSKRENAKERALIALGVLTSYQCAFPDNAMDSIPLLEITKAVEHYLDQFKPDLIYTHFHGDLNVDHQICFNAVMTATRPIPGMCVKEIYGFEVLSSTEWQLKTEQVFTPQLYVDVSDCFTDKIKALEAYSDEMRESPHSRSMDHVDGLGKHRGHTIGVEYAEAFMTYRIIRD